MTKKLKYLKVYDDIKDKILSGVYPVNHKLADGVSLAKEYEVSLMTAKKALDELAAEGFLIRRQGYGTVVKDWTKSHLYIPEGSYHKWKGKVKSKILQFDIKRTSLEIVDKLAIDKYDFVYYIERLRIIDEVPSIIEYIYMPISIVPNLKYEHLTTSIYQYMQEELGLVVHSSFLNIKGARPNELEKVNLGLDDSDFLIQMEQIVDLNDGRIFEYSIVRHIPEEFEFETIIFNK